MKAIYQIRLWLSQPVADDDDDFDTPDTATSRPRQREIEKDVLRTIRAAKLGLEVDDIEIVDVEIED